VKGMNSCNLLYEPMHGGYGALVVLGRNYTINGSLQGDISTELSDVLLEETFGDPDHLEVWVSDVPCLLSAQDDRSHLGLHGPPPETHLSTPLSQSLPPQPPCRRLPLQVATAPWSLRSLAAQMAATQICAPQGSLRSAAPVPKVHTPVRRHL